MKLNLTPLKQKRFSFLESKEKLIKEVEKGNVDAICSYGSFLLGGFTCSSIDKAGNKHEWKIEKNIEKGLHYLEQASQKQHINALMRLLMYYYVQNFNVDKVLDICSKLKDLDMPQGYLYEALTYERGLGIEKNEDYAIKILKELKDSGYNKSLLYLSRIYCDPKNNNYDLTKGLDYFKEHLTYFSENMEGARFTLNLLMSILKRRPNLTQNQQNKIQDCLEELKNLIENPENNVIKVNKNFLLCDFLKARALFELVLKNNYASYKYFQLSHKKNIERQKAFATIIPDFLVKEKTEEEIYLEHVLGIEKNGSHSKIIKNALKIYDKEDAPYSIKRRFIQSYAEKLINSILNKKIKLLDDGTISNLYGALNHFLQAEILDIDEERQIKKYPNLVVNTSSRINEIETNYSDNAYLLLSGLERLLKNLFFDPYIAYLENNSKTNPNINIEYKNLKTSLRVKQNVKPQVFTIGTFITMVGRNYNENNERVVNSDFLNWLKNHYNINDPTLIEKLINITDTVEFVGSVIRNPILHGVFAQKWTLIYSLNTLLLNDEALIKQIIALTQDTPLTKPNGNIDFLEHITTTTESQTDLTN